MKLSSELSNTDQTLLDLWLQCNIYLTHTIQELESAPNNKELLNKKNLVVELMQAGGLSAQSADIKEEKLRQYMIDHLATLNPKIKLQNIGKFQMKLEEVRTDLDKKRVRSNSQDKSIGSNILDGLSTMLGIVPEGKKFTDNVDAILQKHKPEQLSQNKSRFLQSTREYDYLFKVLILGDNGVGKSSLLLRFADDKFTESYSGNQGVNFKIKTIDLDGTQTKFQSWDVGNKGSTPSDIRGAHGALVLYDITNQDSFRRAPDFLEKAKNLMSENASILLVGTKCDLVSERKIATEDAAEYAEEMGVNFIEVSSKDGTNVSDAFAKLGVQIKNGIEESPSHGAGKPRK